MDIIEQLHGIDPKKIDIHLHSNFSDGKNNIEEMTAMAVKLGFKAICFTDHVRRDTRWLDNYAEEIRRVRVRYSEIRIFSGFEAKAIDLNGNIDACDNFFDKVEIVTGVIHRVPKGNDDYFSSSEVADPRDIERCWMSAMRGLIKNTKVAIIGHPTTSIDRRNIKLSKTAKIELATLAASQKKIIEFNIKYQTPDAEFMQILLRERVMIFPGSDSHSAKEFEKFAKKV